MYNGLYALCTDFLDDNINGILKISEQHWQIEKNLRCRNNVNETARYKER